MLHLFPGGRPLAAIAKNTLVECLRQPVTLLVILLGGFVQVLNTWNTGFSMGQETTGEVTGDNKLLLDLGMASVFLLGVVLAAFLATAALSKEVESKTVLSVVSKPVPRSTLILGKYAGVSMALVVAAVVLVLALLLSVRHGVMSTAADEVDGPVVTFAGLAVAISLGLAAWCNFYYGWSFPQTASVLLLVTLSIAFGLVLALSKEWHWQAPSTDFKPQVTVACACLILALLVLSSIAVAASTRLGQVMTIVVCLGAFVLALLCNSLVGRYAYRNQIVGVVERVTPGDPVHPELSEAGRTLTVRLMQPPPREIRPGEPFYFSTSPSGFPMLHASFRAPGGDVNDPHVTLDPEKPGALVVVSADGQELKVKRTGGALSMWRQPEGEDYVFTTPTKLNVLALAVWGVVPNLHLFWLLDAVSQSRHIPHEYFVVMAGYTVCQITMFLGVAVLLFQKRDVG
jgi:hypothetical protein